MKKMKVEKKKEDTTVKEVVINDIPSLDKLMSEEDFLSFKSDIKLSVDDTRREEILKDRYTYKVKEGESTSTDSNKKPELRFGRPYPLIPRIKPGANSIDINFVIEENPNIRRNGMPSFSSLSRRMSEDDPSKSFNFEELCHHLFTALETEVGVIKIDGGEPLPETIRILEIAKEKLGR